MPATRNRPGIGATSNRMRVLIVEDDCDSAEALSAILEQAGYEVRVTHNGHQATTLVPEFQPNIA
ncbi:MAG: response regulator, partial [Polyangiaceae bacterium]